MSIVYACAVASQIAVATQILTLPDGTKHIEHVSIVKPCVQEKPVMPSILHKRKAIDRIKKLKEWSKLG